MRTLAIDTATEACSVAFFDGSELLGASHEVMGRGHAERLIPSIAALPDKGRADRILVSLGPGSFTGVRIGIAAARALGVAWSAQVMGYPTLSLVAAQSREENPDAVTVCMNGGHGQWFVQNFDSNGEAEDAMQSLTPQQATLACRHAVIAGNRAQELAVMFERGKRALNLLPDASKAPLLDDRWLTGDLAPIYGREPDARLPA